MSQGTLVGFETTFSLIRNLKEMHFFSYQLVFTHEG